MGENTSEEILPCRKFENFLNISDTESHEFFKHGLHVVGFLNYHSMGYGKRAMTLLRDYYAGKFMDLNENDKPHEEDNGIEEVEESQVGLLKEQILPRRKIPTLLKRLSERQPEHIDYLGTSYGLTKELLKFWKQLAFVPVYVSQKANDLTGEHSCIMLNTIDKNSENNMSSEWLCLYYNDFRRRIIKLLGKNFRQFPIGLGLSLLDNKSVKIEHKALDKPTLDVYFLPHDLQRLEAYSRNQIEFRLILDLVTDISYLYFQGKMEALPIDTLQMAILFAIGVQGKLVDDIAAEINMPGNQILAKFYDMIKKATRYFRNIIEGHIESTMISETKLNKGENLVPISLSLNAELEESAQELSKKQKQELKKLKMESFKEFAIKGTDEDWSNALSQSDGKSKLISVKSGTKRLDEPLGGNDDADETEMHSKKKKKKFGKKFKGKSVI